MNRRTYEEAKHSDSELLRLSEEIMTLEGWLGRNPSKTELEKIARLNRALENRHSALRQEIESENLEVEEAKFHQKGFSKHALAGRFGDHLQGLGKPAHVADSFRSLFMNCGFLRGHSDTFKQRFSLYLEDFIYQLSPADLAIYSEEIEEIRNAAGTQKATSEGQ